MKSQFSIIHFKYHHNVFIETGKIRSDRILMQILSYMYHIYKIQYKTIFIDISKIKNTTILIIIIVI